jgi:Protein of unknown function (DUF2384)
MTAPSEEDEIRRVNRDATELLFMMLGPDFITHAPVDEIAEALERLTDPSDTRSAALDYFQVAADWSDEDVASLEDLSPIEAEDLWLGLAASIIDPLDEPAIDPLPADLLGHPDWLTLGISVHRAGPGVLANPDVLVDWIVADDAIPPDVHAERLGALVTVCRLWRALGVLDDEDRLTPLGVWGVPLSLLDAWEAPPDEVDGDGDGGGDFGVSLDAAALDDYVRAHERRWVDDEIPMFKGKTPRQMVRTAAGRREVEAFLDDIRVQNERAGGGPGTMDPNRIADLLGVPPRIDRK